MALNTLPYTGYSASKTFTNCFEALEGVKTEIDKLNDKNEVGGENAK